MVALKNGSTRQKLPVPATYPSAPAVALSLTTFAGRQWGLYTRISDDAEKDEKGVGRQEADERAWVTSVGGVVGKLYTENDTSAYKKRKIRRADGSCVWRVVRPLWEQMLADLRAGVIDGVVVADLDRLARDPRDLEDAIEIVEHYHRPVIGLTGGFDLMTDNGRFAARILVAAANKASADTARRVRRKHLELQSEGATGAGPRPFGWNDDHRTLHPVEAPIVRQVCADVAAGIPLDAIVRDLNARGITGTRGAPWYVSTIKPYLRNPRLCGWRGRIIHEPDPTSGQTCIYNAVVRDADGQPVTGQWEPLITPAQWETVTGIIGWRKQPGRGHNARRYLLSGITRCGECGRRLLGMPRPDRGFAYRCNPQNLGCSKIVRDGVNVDRYVVAAVIAKIELELTETATRVETEWARAAELADVQERISALNQHYRARTISSDRYFAQLQHFETEERELLGERRAHAAQAQAVRDQPANIRAEWDTYPLSRRRAIIEDSVHAIIVKKARYKGSRFDPDLIVIEWKGGIAA